MKLSSFKKNKIVSVRVNSSVLDLLKLRGYSLQRLLDEAIGRLINLEIKFKEKDSKPGE